MGRVRARRARRADHQSPHQLSDNSAEDEDRDCHDHLREIEQDDLLQEDGDTIESQNIERSDEKHQDHEPHHEGAKKAPDVEIEARLFGRLVETCGAQSIIDPEDFDDLNNDPIEDDSNDPADDENDNGREDRGKILHYREPQTGKRGLYYICRLRNYHINNDL